MRPLIPTATNVISNLRNTDPRLITIADWRIDAAHREYSSSSDFGDDTLVFNWLPANTEDARMAYITLQMQDQNRTIAELERYVRDLRRELSVKGAE